MSPLPPLLVLGCYLLGSIPFSYLIARLVIRRDVRTVGSGNVGATNVFRSAGKLAGFTALVLDLLKGWSAIQIAKLLIRQSAWPWTLAGEVWWESASFWIGLGALLAVIGHIYPIWLGFRGGKGVATATGAFLGLAPLALLFAALLFAGVVLSTRYVSLASITAAAAVPLITRFVTGAPFWTIVFSIAISLIVILKHRSNIARLARGEERKLGEKEKPR